MFLVIIGGKKTPETRDGKKARRRHPDLGEMSVCCISQPVSVLASLAGQGSLEV